MFELRFDTANAAFGETSHERGEEIARILRDLANRVEQGFASGVVWDVNGNKIGSFSIVEGK